MKKTKYKKYGNLLTEIRISTQVKWMVGANKLPKTCNN